MKECDTLKRQVKGLQSDKEKNTWSGSANGNGCTQYYSQQELNAIIGKSVKAALKKGCKDRTQQEEHNTIDEFNALSLSLQAMMMTSVAPERETVMQTMMPS
eukprot:1669621-Ditylum_brightwellii.AAC.3